MNSSKFLSRSLRGAVSRTLFVIAAAALGAAGMNAQTTDASRPEGGSPLFAQNDPTGDGRSDFTMVRIASGSRPLTDVMGVNDVTGKRKDRLRREAPDMVGTNWFIADSNENPVAVFSFGLATDTFLMADMVGDSKDDLVVARRQTGTGHVFYILDPGTGVVSSKVLAHGNPTGIEDPTVVADFDGDGKDDPAVYSPGTTNGAQSYFYWTPAANPGAVNQFTWGLGSDTGFTFDYDGDGLADVGVQRGNGSGGSIFYLLTATGAMEVINGYGLASDFITTGDFDGDGRDDLCVSRNANFGGGLYKYFFPRSSATGQVTFIQWGLPNDVITPGDYDGDGISDFAVWRPSAVNSTFYIMKSSGGFQTFVYGLSADYPASNWSVH